MLRKRYRFNSVVQGADYDEEELAFLKAIDAYKRDNQCPFPSWCEILAVFKSLGYVKVAPPAPLPGVPAPSGEEPRP